MAKQKKWDDMNRQEKTIGIVGLGIIVLIVALVIAANIPKSKTINTRSTADTQPSSNQTDANPNTPSSSATASTPAPATPTPAPTPKPAPAKTTTPAPAPAAPKTLLSLSGSGIENSSPFLVTESQLTVTYSYDCSSFGGSGNFIADLEYGDQSSSNSDDQTIANALSSGATNVTTTIYPQDPGQDYYLAVNSECNWTVTVTT